MIESVTDNFVRSNSGKVGAEQITKNPSYFQGRDGYTWEAD